MASVAKPSTFPLMRILLFFYSSLRKQREESLRHFAHRDEEASAFA